MTDRRYFQFVYPLELGYIFITEWGWPCGKASPIGLEDFLPVCDAGKGAPLTGLPFFLSLLLPRQIITVIHHRIRRMSRRTLSFGTFVHGSFQAMHATGGSPQVPAQLLLGVLLVVLAVQGAQRLGQLHGVPGVADRLK